MRSELKMGMQFSENKQALIIVKNITKYYPLMGKTQLLNGGSRFTLLKNLLARQQVKEYKALDDICFEVYPGEAMGLIGSNGSGKTTLLRIITGIVQPTSGYAIVRGAFGELFSLNSGFNMRLTGRQNIYLYAAIKGIPSREIEARIDEIIEFSELEEFIDQSMKTYSSGMRGRLGFSLVIHNLPNVVLIDEALATGDRRFQAKCREKFKDWMNGGDRTIVLVSHSERAIRDICNRAIWLEKGQIRVAGGVDEVLGAYHKFADHQRGFPGR